VLPARDLKITIHLALVASPKRFENRADACLIRILQAGFLRLLIARRALTDDLLQSGRLHAIPLKGLYQGEDFNQNCVARARARARFKS
jgi:hypothetical protein